LKFPQIHAQNSVIPGNSRGNYWDGGFPWPSQVTTTGSQVHNLAIIPIGYSEPTKQLAQFGRRYTVTWRPIPVPEELRRIWA